MDYPLSFMLVILHWFTHCSAFLPIGMNRTRLIGIHRGDRSSLQHHPRRVKLPREKGILILRETRESQVRYLCDVKSSIISLIFPKHFILVRIMVDFGGSKEPWVESRNPPRMGSSSLTEHPEHAFSEPNTKATCQHVSGGLWKPENLKEACYCIPLLE